jgi:hypothetical protein
MSIAATVLIASGTDATNLQALLFFMLIVSNQYKPCLSLLHMHNILVCNEELHELYCSANVNKMKSMRMSWGGHVARMERIEVYSGFWWEC